jgi:DNA-binding LacI/PurR family transcriptional regulator
MRPTMADVAKQAGVSVSTVSLVLNDRPGVSPEVRSAVLKAADNLGYRLPTRRSPKPASETKAITVVHYAGPESVSTSEVSGLFVDFMASIREFFQDKNVNWTLIANYREGDESNLGFHFLEGGQLSCDGMLIVGILSQHSRLVQQAVEEDIPLVVLSRNWPEAPISTVSQDHRQQARIALDHLIGLGHRKIGFLARESDRHYDWFQARLACYQDTMAELGEQDGEALIAVGTDGAGAAKELMARRPDVTAIFAIHDENAVAAMQGLREVGLRVPEDVSVIGLDDSAKPPEGYPALTTVAFPHHEVGRLAAELLLKQIEDSTLLYSKVFVRSHLIERASCSKPRG